MTIMLQLTECPETITVHVSSHFRLFKRLVFFLEKSSKCFPILNSLRILWKTILIRKRTTMHFFLLLYTFIDLPFRREHRASHHLFLSWVSLINVARVFFHRKKYNGFSARLYAIIHVMELHYTEQFFRKNFLFNILSFKHT